MTTWYGNPDGTVKEVNYERAREWAAGYLKRNQTKDRPLPPGFAKTMRQAVGEELANIWRMRENRTSEKPQDKRSEGNQG